MGTRADFYVGRGEQAEWLGSIAFDGYPDGIPERVRCASTEEMYREALDEMFRTDDSASGPDHGWPWPWENSNTTDYAYAYEDGVWVTCFGHGWDRIKDYDPDDERDRPKVTFPDMSRFKVVARAGSKRSGLMSFSMPSVP